MKQQITVDQEFKRLIPESSQEEIELLEKSILENGIRDPLDVWGNIIIDGHNRYAIARKHGIDFSTRELSFQDRTEAMVWIIDNQRGRRNLTIVQRAELGIRRAELLRVKAEENLREGGRRGGEDKPLQKSEKAIQPVNLTAEAAKFAGVSTDTISKVKKIASEAPEEIKEKVRTGKMSINRAYQQIRSGKPEKEEKKASAKEDQKKEGNQIALRVIGFADRELAKAPELAKDTAISIIMQWLKTQKGKTT